MPEAGVTPIASVTTSAAGMVSATDRKLSLKPFAKPSFRAPDPSASPAPSPEEQTVHPMALTRRHALTGLLSLPLAACGSGGADNFGFTLPTSAGLNEEVTRGFVMDDELIGKVKPGMDVQQVLQTLGTPSTTSTVGNRTFYYISQRAARQFQFQSLQVVDQNVLAIYFNQRFKVERIANFGLKDGVIFDFISRTTPTGGEEQSFLRNLFRGVTRFNPFGS
jgi:outer membrane protein assembly factor BamE (lipoprotein component of BamABCDE complex)